MNNRSTSSPILLAAILSLTLTPAPFAKAEPGVPADPSASTNAAPLPTPAPAPAAPAQTDAAPAERPSTYTVTSGDSLWLIAHRFHCSVNSLKKLNNLKNNNLKPGETLQIPPAKGGTPAGATPPQKTTSIKPKSHAASQAKTASTQPVTSPAKPQAASAPKTASIKPHVASPIKTVSAQPVTPPAQPETTPKTASIKPHIAPQTKTVSTEPVASPSPTEPEPATTYLRAQPVQDFDIPASTFASCPPPPSSSDEDTAPPAVEPQPAPVAPVVAETPAPRAQPVSAADLAQSTPAPAPEQSPGWTNVHDSASSSSKHPQDTDHVISTTVVKVEPQTSVHQSDSLSLYTSSSDWGNRFLRTARELGDRGIEYDESWRPPGESHSWDMDCSNTSRYIYKVTTGIELPRTASDQYYYLHLQNKAWDVPQTQTGFADCTYLRQNLKPGDLLFWENTYKPERQPPITHVMVFLGTNAKGQWIMAGSQTSHGGEHNRAHGGPDIYVFDPTRPCGGYSTWMGLVHHQGRFCAFGRPLEADKSKLAVAANN